MKSSNLHQPTSSMLETIVSGFLPDSISFTSADDLLEGEEEKSITAAAFLGLSKVRSGKDPNFFVQ